MQQYLTIILTATVTASTIIYTVYSIRLWQTSRQSAEIARQAALASLWTELNRLIELSKQEGRPEAKFLEELSGIFAEYMISRLLNDVDTKSDSHLRTFQLKIEELVNASDVDAGKLKWLTPFTQKKK